MNPSPIPSPLRTLLGRASLTLALATLVPTGAPFAQDDEALRATLEAEGIGLDLEAGVVVIPADVVVKDDLLEYLLVGPRGAMHESLFATPVRPSLLNAALLSLGVEPGTNARWEEGELASGDPDVRLLLPQGGGFLLYAAWREGDETYFFRLDDLVSNLDTGRSMRRHRWVFLGSRFKRPREDEPEVFVADLEQNLICLSFFYQGNTLLTAALPECQMQTIWVANPWLVPPRDSRVALIFAKQALERLPDSVAATLPVLPETPEPDTPSADDAR